MSQQFNRLGSAKSGAHHWLAQRGSALFLLYLNLWLISTIHTISTLPYNDIVMHFAQPIPATHLVLYVAAAAYHAQLGLQVVLEDYVHCRIKKITALVLIKFTACFLVGLTLLSVVKIMIRGMLGS